VSGVAGTPVLVRRHTSQVAVQPVRLIGDLVLPARAAEPMVKLSPHPVLGKVC
jgi:hypothetical protein